MVVATVGMMIVYFTSGTAAARNPMFMFFPVMMLGSLLGTVAMGARGGSRAADINQDRRDYLRYLASLEASIAKTVDAQHRFTDLEPSRSRVALDVGRRQANVGAQARGRRLRARSGRDGYSVSVDQAGHSRTRHRWSSWTLSPRWSCGG